MSLDEQEDIRGMERDGVPRLRIARDLGTGSVRSARQILRYSPALKWGLTRT